MQTREKKEEEEGKKKRGSGHFIAITVLVETFMVTTPTPLSF
jgi:hypothetical protein